MSWVRLRVKMKTFKLWVLSIIISLDGLDDLGQRDTSKEIFLFCLNQNSKIWLRLWNLKPGFKCWQQVIFKIWRPGVNPMKLLGVKIKSEFYKISKSGNGERQTIATKILPLLTCHCFGAFWAFCRKIPVKDFKMGSGYSSSSQFRNNKIKSRRFFTNWLHSEVVL